jgi:hypothetical protein
MTERPPFPEHLDNTALSGFRDCPKYFFWQQIRRIVPRGTSIHLDFGGAFASGLEAARTAYYVQGLSQSDAEVIGLHTAWQHFRNDDRLPAEESTKDALGLIRALEAYLDTWPFETDSLQPVKFSNGQYGIEFSFAVPIPVAHPVTGNPLIICGRADMIGEIQNPRTIFVVDEKTSKMAYANPLWNLRSQFMTYTWAARQHGNDVAGVIIRQIIMHKNDLPCQQEVVYHPEWSINRWYEQTLRDAEHAIAAWKTGVFDYNLSTRCGAYGGCPYSRLCQVANPEPWINIDYRPNLWNPLTRTEEVPITG